MLSILNDLIFILYNKNGNTIGYFNNISYISYSFKKFISICVLTTDGFKTYHIELNKYLFHIIKFKDFLNKGDCLNENFK